jgi:hypothetical protein
MAIQHAVERLKASAETASDMGDNEFKRQVQRAKTALMTARATLNNDMDYYARGHDKRNKTKMLAALKQAVKGVQDALKALDVVEDEQVD